MIGKLSGTLDLVQSDGIILDVNGVGYNVACSAQTLGHLPEVGQPCKLFIETIVQEGAIKLVGFQTQEENAFFNLLLSVQGIGVRLALAILGFFPSLITLAHLLEKGDQTSLSRVPGVGKRLAARACADLAERVGKLELPKSTNAQEDALEALVALGFSRTLVYQSLNSMLGELGDAPVTSQALIRVGLKVLKSA